MSKGHDNTIMKVTVNSDLLKNALMAARTLIPFRKKYVSQWYEYIYVSIIRVDESYSWVSDNLYGKWGIDIFAVNKRGTWMYEAIVPVEKIENGVSAHFAIIPKDILVNRDLPKDKNGDVKISINLDEMVMRMYNGSGSLFRYSIYQFPPAPTDVTKMFGDKSKYVGYFDKDKLVKAMDRYLFCGKRYKEPYPRSFVNQIMIDLVRDKIVATDGHVLLVDDASMIGINNISVDLDHIAIDMIQFPRLRKILSHKYVDLWEADMVMYYVIPTPNNSYYQRIGFAKSMLSYPDWYDVYDRAQKLVKEYTTIDAESVYSIFEEAKYVSCQRIGFEGDKVMLMDINEEVLHTISRPIKVFDIDYIVFDYALFRDAIKSLGKSRTFKIAVVLLNGKGAIIRSDNGADAIVMSVWTKRDEEAEDGEFAEKEEVANG